MIKTVYIETLGCAKNQVDSENMLGILDDAKYELAQAPEEAQIIIINTCTFIHDAKEESINTILDFTQFKEHGNCECLIITGCLSQRYSEELLEEIKEIDGIIGTGNFFKIDSVVEAIYKQLEANEAISIKDKMYMEDINLVVPEDLSRIMTTPENFAYIKISEGCDNRCTYCIIPKLRGKYRSRKIEDIISEAKELAEMGYKELIIIAQDTSRYGIDLYDAYKLPELLTELNKIENVKWIRVLYSYPDIMDEGIVKAYTDNEKVVNYFDIPIQHGSNKILKRMNRQTSNEDIKKLVKTIRSLDENASIRTTVITGFPGETEEDFNALMALAKEIEFDKLGAFAYSNEEGTPAYKLDGQVPMEVREARRNELMTLQMEISKNKNYYKIGKTYEVVIEEVAEEGKIYVGRTKYDAPEIDGVVYVHTQKPLEIGAYYNVSINDALEYDLIGNVMDN